MNPTGSTKWSPTDVESLAPFLGALLDSIPFGVQFVAPRDGRNVVVFANRRFCEIVGMSADQVIGVDDTAILQRCVPDRMAQLLQTVGSGDRKPQRIELSEPRRIVECRTVTLHDSAGRSNGFLRVWSDVTAAEAAGTAHSETEARLSGIIGSAMDAIITIDEDQRVVVFNAAAEKTFGITAGEAIGQPLDRFIPERFRPTHREHIRKFGLTNVTVRAMGRLASLFGLRSDGTEFPIEASISQVEVQGKKLYSVILRDITDKRRVEQQLLRAQRLESVGTLAGGLAHDLNNILAPIMLSVRILERKLTGDPEGLETVAMLDQLAQRGANIIRQVLSFARGQEGERVPLVVKHVVREVGDILRETLPRNITVHQEVPSDLWSVLGDPTQLHQILMNLAVNARDAMPTGGTITLAVTNVTLDQHFAQMQPEAHPGRYVSISVSDNGTGIAPDHLDRIFDPFFTTKPHGEGTGLGLSMTLGIVRAHGGFVNVYSEPGRGTRFTVYLPAVHEEKVERPAEARPKMASGHGELILIVDDEAPIRAMTSQALQAFGYRTLVAEDGTAAVSLFAQRQGDIDVVLLDMMMPFMDGQMTARALDRIRPGVRVIGTSGLEGQRRVAEAEGIHFAAFLPKPYTADQLLRVLSEVLAPGRAVGDGAA
jgi:PAS domain S-box-containing protein